MAFSDDSGGFAFSCDDAKISIVASTWSTRLSQLARMGPMFVMTRLLPNLEYIGRIVGKRPRDIYILASTEAEADARQLKAQFPGIRIALHHNVNAKVVLVSPNIIWLGSSDFGESKKIESAVGLHSDIVFSKTINSLFNPIWSQAREI